jgi:Kef-type K+ transport system membrane component KefB
MTETVQFFLALGVMIAFAKAMGYLTYRLDQPAVLGELLAGLLIGPTVINFLGNPTLFPDGHSVEHTLIEIAEVGVLLLMFMAGMEVDLKSMKEVGRPALLAGLIGVVFPLVVITPVVVLFNYPVENALFIGILMASMSTSISAQVMLELGVLRRREGLTLLGAALVDDAIVILLLSLFVAINPGGIIPIDEPRSVIEVLLRIGGFLLIGSVLSWILLPRIANLVDRLRIAEGALMVAIVATLMLSFSAEFFGGIAGITGAFLAGLCISRARNSVVEKIERGLHAVNYSLLLPLFFISIGLRANLRLLTADLLPFALIITVLAIVTKIVGAGGGSMLGGFDRTSALRVGLGMISRGEVGLIIAAIGIGYGILTEEVFTVIVFVVLVTTIMTPPLVRWSFRERTTAAPPAVPPIDESKSVAQGG